MVAVRWWRCKCKHLPLRRWSSSVKPLPDPPPRMYSFTRAWLPKDAINARIESLLQARGLDLSFLNAIDDKLDDWDRDFSRALNHLFDVSSDAALAFYFFRSTQRSLGIQHSLHTLCTMIHISVSGNMNHIAMNLLRSIVSGLGEGEGDRIDLVFNVLRDVSSEREVLGTVYSMLVRCCVDIRNVGACLELMGRMERFGFFPSVGGYAALIKVLLEYGQMSIAWKVFDEMPNSGDASRSVLLGLFVHGYVEHGNFGVAWKLILDMWSYGGGVDVINYTTVIRGLCKQGHLREGTCLLYKMLQMGVILDSVLISSLVDGYCKAGRLKEVKIFLSFPECVPDVFMYNSFMLQLCREGNVVEAKRLLDEMFEVGVDPDSFNYDTLVAGYCKSGMVEEALKVFGQMKKRGHQPGVLTYTVLIKGHGKKQCELQSVEVFFHAMKTDGLQPDVLAYNAMINVFCQRGYMNKAYELMNMMKQDGVFPDVATYNILMHGLIKRGFISESREIFHELRRRGFSLDKITYTEMIHGYSKQGNLKEAYLIWCSMSENGTKPDVVTCSALLNALCKARQMQDALVLFRKMLNIGLEPDLIMYNTLIHGFCGEGDVVKACELLSMMANHGILPNDATCQSLIYGLEKNGIENPIESAALKLHQIFHAN